MNLLKEYEKLVNKNVFIKREIVLKQLVLILNCETKIYRIGLTDWSLYFTKDIRSGIVLPKKNYLNVLIKLGNDKPFKHESGIISLINILKLIILNPDLEKFIFELT